jgi:hypothetical protein
MYTDIIIISGSFAVLLMILYLVMANRKVKKAVHPSADWQDIWKDRMKGKKYEG